MGRESVKKLRNYLHLEVLDSENFCGVESFLHLPEAELVCSYSSTFTLMAVKRKAQEAFGKPQGKYPPCL